MFNVRYIIIEYINTNDKGAISCWFRPNQEYFSNYSSIVNTFPLLEKFISKSVNLIPSPLSISAIP